MSRRLIWAMVAMAALASGFEETGRAPIASEVSSEAPVKARVSSVNDTKSDAGRGLGPSPSHPATVEAVGGSTSSSGEVAAYSLDWYSIPGTGSGLNLTSASYLVDVIEGEAVTGTASSSSITAGFGFLSGALAGSNCLIARTGDVNVSGTITSADVISLVNYVFKSGLPPLPCVAAGDVNCNGAVTSADVIFLVNFVFKGGPAPCDACTGSPLAGSC